VTTRALLPPPTIVRETRIGALLAATAVFVSDSRGGAFTTLRLPPPLTPVKACCETAPPATGKIPFVKLIGSFPRTSSGCAGTNPSNPVLERTNTPVTGRNRENPPNPPPNPNPGDHNHPNTGSNTQPP
jgi:hypothetical protein